MIKYLWTVVTRFFSPLIKLYKFMIWDEIDDIPVADDLRSKLDERGVITECFYCKNPIRIDGDNGDYNTIPHDGYHCNLCEDIYEGNCSDYREDTTQRGNIIECYYCGTAMLIDGDNNPLNDYSIHEPEIHCDDCLSDAQRNLT